MATTQELDLILNDHPDGVRLEVSKGIWIYFDSYRSWDRSKIVFCMNKGAKVVMEMDIDTFDRIEWIDHTIKFRRKEDYELIYEMVKDDGE